MTDQTNSARLNRRRPLLNEQLSHLFGQLAMLLGAGITAPDGLAVMQSDADNGDLAPVLEELAERITGGASLSEAADSAGVFPAYAVELARIGEETGQIDRICAMLADYYEEQADLRSAVRDALFYPFIMILMMLILIVVLLTGVMPLFAQVFEQLGASVSGIALVLLNLSNVLSSGSAILIVIAALLCAFTLWLLETDSGRRALHRFLQWFPPTRGFTRRMAVGRFASALQITQESGMDTAAALKLCRNIADNDAVAAGIEDAAARLEEGATLAGALSGAGIFTGFYSAMLRVADETGSVSTVLGYIAAYYKEETDQGIDRLLARIEPAIVAVTAVVVGIVLLSVILPLMGVMTGIG